MVQPGDGVIEGQLLISGIVESETGSNHAVFARGKVVAETRREFTAKIPMEQIERKKTGETLVRESVLFFGLRFPVTLREAPEGLWDCLLYTSHTGFFSQFQCFFPVCAERVQKDADGKWIHKRPVSYTHLLISVS